MSSWEITGYHKTLVSALVRLKHDYVSEYDAAAKKYGPVLAEIPDEMEERRVLLILISHALIEALINRYLSVKLDTDKFAKIERKSILSKWTTCVCELVPAYVVPAQLKDALDRLNERRNGITHMRPELQRDGQLIHSGNEPTLEIEHHRILEWTELPMKLMQNLASVDQSDDVRTLMTMLEHDFIYAQARRPRRRARSDGP